MKPKVLSGSIAGVAVMLVGIGGTWVILNFEAVAAKALEAGIKLAAKRGVQLTPETVKLLLKLSGGAAGATAGAAGQAAASGGRRAAGKARQAGTGAAGKARQTGTGAAGKARQTGTGTAGKARQAGTGAAGKARQTGTGTARRVAKAAQSSG